MKEILSYISNNLEVNGTLTTDGKELQGVTDIIQDGKMKSIREKI